MNTLAESLKELHRLKWQFNPPATTAEIDYLSASLNCSLPEPLVKIYRDHNGIQADHAESHPPIRLVFKLMSIQEVLYHRQLLRDFETLHPEYWSPPEVRYFWIEDNSNYAGVFTSGSLVGKLCVYDHEAPVLAPCYRSIESFYHHLLEHVAVMSDLDNIPAWYEMPSDYPRLADAPETDPAEMELALDFTAQFEAVTDQRYETRFHRHTLGFTAMNLLPFSASDHLLPFTESSDMWIQAYACELLGERRYLPAIPRLQAIAQNGTHNGRLAARSALAKMTGN